MADLKEVLSHYAIEGEVIKKQQGPLITEIKFRPAAGTKLKTIANALPDIAREMGFPSLRLSNVCDDHCIGFEVPNEKFETVYLDSLLKDEAFQNFQADLPLLMGVDVSGRPFFADLSKMPHLLIAGATGSGKSVQLHALILSLMKRLSPNTLKFVMIDPKRIEFALYNDQKYLLMPVINDNTQAQSALEMLVQEMNKRYQLFENAKVRNIAEYHLLGRALPYLVVVIDEFSDLVLSMNTITSQILLLAQKARAAGIHLILATQRPSVDVVTGSIKANFPARLAFKTASAVDSKTILDTTGAQDLLGRGDGLYLSADGTQTRLHGAYIDNMGIKAFLEPFRAPVQTPPNLTNQIAPEPLKSKKKETPQSFFLLTWLTAFWKWLGKRNQKKILNYLLEHILKKR